MSDIFLLFDGKHETLEQAEAIGSQYGEWEFVLAANSLESAQLYVLKHQHVDSVPEWDEYSFGRWFAVCTRTLGDTAFPVSFRIVQSQVYEGE